VTFSSGKFVRYDDLPMADLLPGQIYESGPGKGLTHEPLSQLLRVGNSGGFRWRGRREESPFVVLTSTSNEEQWMDTLTGRTLEYFGDKKGASEKGITETRGGNKILKRNFELAYGSARDRARTQVFLFFSRVQPRSWRFEGLALPGARGLDQTQALKIVQNRTNEEGDFENYLATFTVVKPKIIKRTDLETWSPRSAGTPSGPTEWELWVENPEWWPS